MPRLIMTAMLGSALLMATGAGAAPGRPLHLVTDRIGTDVRIRVVGHGEACRAQYALTVVNRSAGGTSRSVQRGTASVRPGAPATFVTSRLVGVATGTWTAHLAVHGCGADADYDESSDTAATSG